MHVGEQDGALCLWAAVGHELDYIPYKISIVGTGHEWTAESLESYVGTAQVGSLVWHVFAVERYRAEDQRR